MTMQLIEAQMLRYPLLNLSEWLEPRRDEYQDRLLRTSITGDLDAWVSFMADGITAQADSAIDRIERLLAVRQSLIETILSAGSRRGGATYRIADELIGYPIIDVPSTAQRQGVSYQSARIIRRASRDPSKRKDAEDLPRSPGPRGSGSLKAVPRLDGGRQQPSGVLA